jgi:hypothetical protein
MFPVLVAELQRQLSFYGITGFDEVTLRQELEARTPTYTLIKLADWPARRWKCRYRLMMGDAMHDAQSVPEAYALALLAVLSQPSNAPSTGENDDLSQS